MELIPLVSMECNYMIHNSTHSHEKFHVTIINTTVSSRSRSLGFAPHWTNGHLATCNSVLSTKVLAMATASPFCLACGQATLPNNRRLLNGDTAIVVRQVWQGLLAEKLEQKRIEVDIKSVLGGVA